MNGLTPVGRLRRGECLLISTRDDDVAHFQSGSNKKDAREARDIGLASVSSAEMRGAEMKQGMADGVVHGFSRRSKSRIDIWVGSEVGTGVSSGAGG